MSEQYTPLDVFAAAAVTSARQWYLGFVALQDAVDVLEAEARRAKLDTDVAQWVMAEAFRPYRKAAPMNDTDFEDGILYESEHDDREHEDAQARKSNGGDARSKNKHTASGWKYHSGVSAIAPRWLVKGILPETGGALMAGQWGTFKTTVALGISVCVMADLPFAGRYRIKRRGAVIYFALEREGMLSARLDAVAKHLGVSDPLPFAWRGDCPPLVNKDAAEQLCTIIDEAATNFDREYGLPLALIWFDTVVTAAGYDKGDDNDTAASQKVMSTLRAVSRHTNALVVGIDHFGKAVETGTRGSSAKEGAADTVLALLGEREVSGAVRNTKLAVRKQRDGISGFELPFTAQIVKTGEDDDGEPTTAVVLNWQAAAATPESGARWTPSMQLLRRVLMTMLADNGKDVRPFNDGPTVRACDIQLVRAEFYRQHPADGTDKQKADARRQAFNRAFSTCQSRNLIASREVDSIQLIWLAKPESVTERDRA